MTTMNKWTEEKLEQMAEAYFSASLSEAEEQELRQQLAQTDSPTGAAAEAKAQMAFFATARRQDHRAAKPRPTLRIVRITAAAACACLVAFAAWHYTSATAPDCIMYAGGQEITNEQAIVAQMTAQISEMGRQQDYMDETVKNQLSDFRGLIGTGEE